MEQLRPQSGHEAAGDGMCAARKRPRARVNWAWVRWLIVLAVIALWVRLLIEQVSMPLMAHSLPFDAWYGNWREVFVMSAVFLAFILGFAWPKGRAEWRNAGMYSAFLISLFVEMFGLPLTIYLVSPILELPANAFGLNESHLWAYLLDRSGMMTLARGVQVVMVTSVALITCGVALLAVGWAQVFRARYQLVTTGLYRIVRHPQYLGLMMIVLAFNIQWPTILTLLMAPALIVMYVRQARREDTNLAALFGAAFLDYEARTPAFIPGTGGRRNSRRGVRYPEQSGAPAPEREKG